MRLDTNFIFNKINGIEFGLLSPKTIQKMSAVTVTSSELYDIDGFPIDGGLSDLRMGVTDPGLICKTCGNTIKDCPGHFGSIELARPVFNIKMVPYVYNLINATCNACGRVLIPENSLKKLSETLIAVEAHEGVQKRMKTIKAIIKHAKNVTVCPFCKEKQQKTKLEKPYTFVYAGQKLTPVDVLERLEKIKDSDLQFLGLDPDHSRPEWMVISLLPVPPITIRPSITLENGQRSEDDLTHKLTDIVRTNQRLAENIKSGAPEIIIDELWDLLQYHITTFISNGTAQVPIARHKSGKKLKTLEDRVKGKEGRFRGSVLGKRVNYGARSVISPDATLRLDEVGVPVQIAKEITFPEYVTDINIERVKELVKNFNSYPGANYIITPDGIKKKITDATMGNLLEEIKPGYIIERHLVDGDMVLFNRQPSLHRLSIMGHYVRVLPYNTLGINPASTLPYNADFDGDEMNIHVLQNEEALAEADMIINIKHNIVSPRHGLPLIGAAQDYVSGCAMITGKSMVVDRETAEFFLSNIGIEQQLKKDKYNGRELFSMLLPKDLNFESQSTTYKITKEEDSFVRIKNGKLETGVIDSATIGKENGSLLQFLFVRYGSDITATFIDQSSRLGLMVLLKYGMSVNMSDFDLPKIAFTKINEVIDAGEKETAEILKTSNELNEARALSLTNKMRVRIRNVIDTFIQKNNNNVESMITTGAKGSITNLIPSVGAVGQQLLRDVRISNGFEGRLTAHYLKTDKSLKARGFICSNYRSGLNPVEYFLHSASSREGLMDNVIRTPISGYMQRRLSSALQDLRVSNDLSVRLGNKVVQFLYGEDGLDVSASDKGDLKI
ncbi:MAG: DNA-directed RNA polymerase subunit A' [Candidatus Parvarchaeota archaeon]|nr:DNA-directed RNA polymerase subunit A' [Candidatus Parvarchaeota archaeon]